MARSANKLLVPGIQEFLDQVKYEIAEEFGVQLSGIQKPGNGSVGGDYETPRSSSPSPVGE